EISAGIFLELEETERKKLLRLLSPKEIAEELINEMDTDDAVDIISELSESEQGAVISQLEDKEYAQDIVDLLRYDDDTAGGLMRKEFVQVNKNWNVITAVKAMRKQAEDLEEVYSVYVVDDDNVLLGTLSLKKLLTTSSSTKLEELYNKNIYYVKADDKDENVAKIIQKYDLMENPCCGRTGEITWNHYGGRYLGCGSRRSRRRLPVGSRYHTECCGGRQHPATDQSPFALAFDWDVRRALRSKHHQRFQHGNGKIQNSIVVRPLDSIYCGKCWNSVIRNRSSRFGQRYHQK